GDDVELASGPLRVKRLCGEVALAAGQFEARSVVPGGSSDDKGRFALLRTGTRIALSVQRGGPAVAFLQVQPGVEESVSVGEATLRQSRIVWWHKTVFVFGWVAATDLRPMTGQGYGTGSGRGTGAAPPLTGDVVVCDHELPLVAEAGGERATVGTVRAGTRIA